MNDRTLRNPVARQLPLRYRWQNALGGFVGNRFESVLAGFTQGQLSLTWPDGHVTQHGQHHDHPDHNATVVLHNYRPIRLLMLDGENGFAESYLRGDWTTDSLSNLFNLILRNEDKLLTRVSGVWLSRLQNIWRHGSNRNSLRGSQRNIAYHYDLGNEFYKLWLDETMSYSAALFEHEGEVAPSLGQAQRTKLDRAADMLNPQPDARVLEIGCGWGAMARTLAEREEGVSVDGVSLSHEQLAYARQHNQLERIDYRHQDYRHVQGQYDHIVSIEMFEAVGQRYWETYFEKLASLLDSGGSAVLQIITILEERFDEYRNNPDFIQRYIFPGGMLPTKKHLHDLANAAGFDIVDTHWFGEGYADTLKEWRLRFEAARQEVLAQGFDERFLRMWRYYLVYCESGFRHGTTDVGLLKLARR